MIVDGKTHDDMLAWKEEYRVTGNKDLENKIYVWRAKAAQQFYGPLQPSINWDWYEDETFNDVEKILNDLRRDFVIQQAESDYDYSSETIYIQ